MLRPKHDLLWALGLLALPFVLGLLMAAGAIAVKPVRDEARLERSCAGAGVPQR